MVLTPACPQVWKQESWYVTQVGLKLLGTAFSVSVCQVARTLGVCHRTDI